MSQASIRFQCPQCNSVFTAPASAAGKSISCKCGAKPTIPSVSQTAGAASKASSPPTPQQHRPQPQYQPAPQPQYQTAPQPQYQHSPQPQYQPAPQPQVPVGNHATKFCHACGQPIDARAEICPKCGVRQPGMHATGGSFDIGGGASGKNRVMAALLALFLGGFGVHHFYLGRPIQGVLYLLFCWTLIPALVAFIEALVLLCTSDDAFHRQYPG